MLEVLVVKNIVFSSEELVFNFVLVVKMAAPALRIRSEPIFGAKKFKFWSRLNSKSKKKNFLTEAMDNLFSMFLFKSWKTAGSASSLLQYF